MSRTRIVKGDITKIIGGNYKRYSRNNIENIGSKVIQIGKEGGVYYGRPEKFVSPTPQITTSEYALKSMYAHEQFEKLAKELAELPFMLFLISIFGEEIEVSAMSKLYHQLSDHSLIPPEIVVSKYPILGRKGAYSNKDKRIYIWEDVVDKAIIDDDNRAVLAAILVEEYGHYIDNILRIELATDGKEDKDSIDEGAKYARAFYFIDLEKDSQINIASVETKNFSGDLIIDLSLIRQRYMETEEYQVEEENDDDPNQDDWEFFGAGMENGQHGYIEMEALLDAFKQDEEIIKKIYYGNWLRDYSQLIVGATIRLPGEGQKKLQNTKNKHVQNLLQNMPNKLSHEGFVELVELLAAKEFVFGKTQGPYDYKRFLATFRSNYGRLSKDILGIYRPEEHIDNPKGLIDQSIIPVSFQYEYPKGKKTEKKLYSGELSSSLEIDKSFLLKDYIWKDIKEGDRPSSETYMYQQLEMAIAYGQTNEGYRHLGAALHVLEDYFSHSNFLELALIKNGNKKVYPWVEGRQAKDYSQTPIVTGLFLEDDTLASIAPKMAEKMFPIGFEDYYQRKPGDRTFTDAFIITILEDLSKAQKADGSKNNKKYMGMDVSTILKSYESYLKFADGKNKILENAGGVGRFVDIGLQRVGEILSTFTNLVFNLFLDTLDNNIKEIQTHVTNKHYGTNPTHTQLAKDDENHPLNELAALLAIEAVRDVGQAIADIWAGKLQDPGIKKLRNRISKTYITHPKNTDWMDRIVSDWAYKNEPKIKVLESPTFTSHCHKIVQRMISGEKVKEIIEFF